jgi:hypothetical protein
MGMLWEPCYNGAGRSWGSTWEMDRGVGNKTGKLNEHAGVLP